MWILLGFILIINFKEANQILFINGIDKASLSYWFLKTIPAFNVIGHIVKRESLWGDWIVETRAFNIEMISKIENGILKVNSNKLG